MNGRALARRIAPALGAVLVLVVSNRLELQGAKLSAVELTVLAALTLATVFFVEAVAELVVNRRWPDDSTPRDLATLRTILNSCSRSATEAFFQTTIGEHLDHTEVPLGMGDLVRILTHDLDVYDAIDAVV